MIPTLLSFITLNIFLSWAVRHEGIPPSISSLFYKAKTRWTYTMVLAVIGLLMMQVDVGGAIYYAGMTLVLGTAAPDFDHRASLSRWLHFGFTAATVVLAVAYISNLWLGFVAVGMLGVAKLTKLKTAVFWVEVLLFYTVLIGIVVKFN